MDKPKNYAKCYDILGVFPDDDWATVRNAYQRQIKRWHPDRFQNRSHQELAEEKTKELNSAYHELNDHYRRYGVLPADGSAYPSTNAGAEDKGHTNTSDFQPVNNWDDTSSTFTESVTPKRRRFGGPAAAVTVLALAYLVWGGHWFTGPEYEEAGHMEFEAGGLGKDSLLGFSGPQSGSDKFAIRTANNEASPKQSASRVKENLPVPSRQPLANPERDSIPTNSFGRDSFKHEVLAAQGPPHRQTEHVWYYGTSRVFFRFGKVSGWYESESDPLNAVREESVSEPQNDPPRTWKPTTGTKQR